MVLLHASLQFLHAALQKFNILRMNQPMGLSYIVIYLYFSNIK